MTEIYTITGMTCNGCRAGVEKKLNGIPEVKMATVNLEKGEAIIATEKPIKIHDLESVLPEKYTITPKRGHPVIENDSSTVKKTGKSKLEQLKPLLLILGYITVASILIHRKDWNVSEMMLDFMGLFYIVFSFFKLLDLKGFPDSFAMYDPLAKKIPIYGRIYPFIEMGLGLLFLLRFEIFIALVVTIIILGITTIGVTKTLLDKKAIQCACLGTALKLPMTEATFIENAIMIVMAVLMLMNYIV